MIGVLSRPSFFFLLTDKKGGIYATHGGHLHIHGNDKKIIGQPMVDSLKAINGFQFFDWILKTELHCCREAWGTLRMLG